MPVTSPDEPPQNLGPWADAGLSRAVAQQWVRRRFSLREAQAWRGAEVDDALVAATWRAAGVTPEAVAGWREAGIGPGEAVRWREFGVGLTDAQRLIADGHGPDSDEARRAAGDPDD